MILEVRKKRYPISITNFNLVDTCRKLRENNPSAGIILLTAEESDSGDAKGRLRLYAAKSLLICSLSTTLVRVHHLKYGSCM